MPMTIDQLRANLCSYDPRNPISADLAVGYDADEPMPAPAAPGCSCDNCFYGRHEMAADLLFLVDVADALLGPKPTTNGDT